MIFLAFALGVMLSPDTLMLLGNTLGHEGRAALSGLLVAGGLHVLTARTYGRLGLHPAVREGESQVLHAAFGPLVATVLPLCARIVYTVAATTGSLATAGYVFNEVFVYWFPNLGFSFCLLGILVGLNLAGSRVAMLAQLSYVALALGGVLGLAAMGLLEWGQAPFVSEVTASSVVTVRGLLAGLVLFVGFELALFTTPYTAELRSPPGRLMALSLVLAALVFGVWGVVSRHWVAPIRLAESTVPHMVTARAIAGNSGRVVMGMVVLAGTCAAVHALLSAGSHMLAAMARYGLLPAWLSWRQPRPALLVLGAGPAVMMAMGMAGEPETEVYAKAGVLFWLLLYAAIHLAVLVGPCRQTPRAAWGRGTTPAVVSLLSLGALGLGMIGLVWIDREASHLVVFMVFAGASASVLSLAWLGWRRWQPWCAAASTCGDARSTGKHPSGKGETI
jgi:amino acid transporter